MKESTKISKWLLYFSRQEREKRAYQLYTKKRIRLEKLSMDQLGFLRISLKANYDYQRNKYAAFLGTILLGILTGAWRALLHLAEKVIRYASVEVDADPFFIQSWTIIIVIFFITATLLVFVAILGFTKSLYHVHKELLIVEDILKEYKARRYSTENSWVSFFCFTMKRSEREREE